MVNPIFRSDQRAMAPIESSKIPGPKPLFSKDHPDDGQLKKIAEVKRDMFSRLERTLEHAGLPTASIKTPKPGKVLFADRAVFDSIDDLPEFVKNNPCIKGMTNKNVRRAYFLSLDIDVVDTKKLFQYGDERRQLFTDVVNQIVETAKQSALQQANDLTEQICKLMAEVDIKQLIKPQKSWFRLFDAESGDSQIKTITDWYNLASTEVHVKLTDVQQIVNSLGNQLEQLQKLYQRNHESFETLQVEIAAGKFFIELAGSAMHITDPTDPFKQSELAYHKLCLDQFANKIADLEGIGQSVITNAPQILLMQLNIQSLGERIKSLKLIFARWQSQFVTLIANLQSHASKTHDLASILNQHTDILAEFSATQKAVTAIK